MLRQSLRGSLYQPKGGLLTRNEGLARENRFDLAYNASHALALAALRYNGYRSENRYLVFQALVHTVGMEPPLA